MVVAAQSWTETRTKLVGTEVQLFKGGNGEPLLIIHDEMGHPGWLGYHEALARKNTVYVPLVPGYGKSEQLDWVMNMRDMAGWYLQAIDDLGIAPVNVIGFSLGGWLAAEMATMDPHLFKKLVLVCPAGVKPPKGEIADIFPMGAKEYIAKSMLDPKSVPEYSLVCPEEPSAQQGEDWAVAREQSCRLSWRPYMHYPALPRLLPRLKGKPTLIVWGAQDPIIPLSAGEAYQKFIPGSRLVTLQQCGHHPELEMRDEFVSTVQAFLSGK